jgi:alkaline phosphatase D
MNRLTISIFVLFFSHTTLAQRSLLQSGPMVGYGQMTEVMIWAQTTKAASVQVQYWEAESPKQKFKSRTVKTREEDGFTAHVLVDGLQPGRHFEFELLLDGKVTKRLYPYRFQTQPLWQWRTDPPEFTIAFGSCNYVNEPEWDRPGKPYGSDHEIFLRIAEKKPDVMLWLGDNTYYREIEFHSVRGLIRRQTHTRSLPELQQLFGTTHHYAIWDDHDFGPNDADRSWQLKEESLRIHKLFWANQTYGTDEIRSVFGRFEWNDIEFFLLDDRYHRSPNNAPDDAAKTMFGKPQLQWLKDALLNSRAPFKIVVNGNQILNRKSTDEVLANFPAEWDELIGFIKKEKIRGVVFLTGDRHRTELILNRDSTFYPLYDFTSSSLTAGLSPPQGEEIDLKDRVEGTLVGDAHTFGLLKFSGPRADRKLTMETWDHTGKMRWTYEIKARDLQTQRGE